MTSSSRELIITADESWVGNRIDKALGAHPEVGSRSKAEWLISENRVRLPSGPVKSSYKVKSGDFFHVLLPEVASTAELKPFELPLDIVHEDKDLIVINKPAGLVMHPSAGHEDDTLVNALLAHTQDLSFKFGERRPGIVHRLDRDTSGLLVVAKNDQTHESLALQFRARSIHRIYQALTLGKSLNESGSFTSYLARHPTHRKKFASVRGNFSDKNPPPLGKFARTHYKVLQKVSPQVQFVQLKLDTGRTHQIRVHLSEFGSPIVGDELYGALKKLPNISNMDIRNILKQFPRFALHAAELGFQHPTTGQTLSFKVSWPDDLKAFLKNVGVRGIE